MERLMAWAMRNPLTVLVGVLIVSVIAASQLPKLRIAISPQSLIIEGGPDCVFHANPATDSRAKLPPIPDESCH